MIRPAVSTSAPRSRADEATGARMKGTVSADRPQLSPCAFASRLLDAGQPQDALEILEREVASGKESLDVQFLLGSAAFSLRDYPRAQRALCRAVVLSPKHSETHRLLARVLLRQGNVAGAMRLVGRSAQPNGRTALAVELQAPKMNAGEGAFEESEADEPPTSQWTPSARPPKADATRPARDLDPATPVKQTSDDHR